MRKILVFAISLLLLSQIAYADGTPGDFATRKDTKIKVINFSDQFDTASPATVNSALFQLVASNPIVTATASRPIVHATERIDIGTSNPPASFYLDSSDNLIILDTVTGAKTLAELAAAGAGGDNVSIDGVAVTDPDFTSTGDIDFIDTTNTVTANINEDKVLKKHFGDEDWGDITVATNSVTLNTDSVADNEIDYTVVTLSDFTNDAGLLTSETDSLFSVVGRGSIAGADISASNVIVENTASAEVVDTQYLENSIGGDVVVRDGLTVNGTVTAKGGLVLDKKIVYLKVMASGTAVTVGDGQMLFTVSSDLGGMNLVDADAVVYTASTSGLPTWQIRNITDSQDMLSTLITIDENEFSSYTAATPPVIDTTKDDVVTGDRIAIDCDVAGTSTAGTDAILVFQMP